MKGQDVEAPRVTLKPLIFVAGPMDLPDPIVNVRRAVDVSTWICAGAEMVTFVPQLAVLHQLISPRTRADWLAYDLDILAHCDALYRIDGESPRADGEVAEAKRLGIPVFYSMVELHLWAIERAKGGAA